MQDGVDLEQIVATSADNGGSEGRKTGRISGGGRTRGRKPGRRDMRGSAHSRMVHEGILDESVAPGEGRLRQEIMSFKRGGGEEETVKSLKRKKEDIGKKKNELKEKVSRLSVDFSEKETCVKALAEHVA